MEKFKRIYIEISNICNLQCSFCPVVERDKKIMPKDLFKKILFEVSPFTEQVTLHLMGEPLAHPEFREILKICDENYHLHNVKINLTTNGILLNKYAHELSTSKALHQVNFSIHSFKDNFKDKNINPYLLDIFNFTKTCFEKNPELYINYRLWNILETHSQNDSNQSIFDSIENFFEIKINRDIDVGSIKSKRIWNKLYLHFDSRFEWPSLNNELQGTKGFCHGLSSHFGIHADGTVVPCCLDKEAIINLGSLRHSSILEILSSHRAVSIKSGFMQKKLVEALCQKCSYIKRFQ